MHDLESVQVFFDQYQANKAGMDIMMGTFLHGQYFNQ